MRRLPEGGFMIRLLHQGSIRKQEINRIVAKLKEFYGNQRSTPEIRIWGRQDKLRLSTDENFAQTKPAAGEALSSAAYEALQSYTSLFYRSHANLIRTRMREGKILDCHGDLHLEHIHLTPKSVCIFDCIEFNERLRYIDVASDIAFLAMHLDFFGFFSLSRFFVLRMASSMHDSGLLQMIDFYKVYRAYVRGKVEFFRSSAEDISARNKIEALNLSRRFFQLALQYAVAGSAPKAIIVMGRIGSGKTALARALAQELGWPLFSSDEERKRLAGLPLHQPSENSIRPWLYSEKTTQRTYARLLRNALQQTKTGKGVVLDATFSRRVHRDHFRSHLTNAGVSFCFLETRASKTLVRKRLQARAHENTQASDARLQDFDKVNAFYEPPDELSGPEWIPLSTSGLLEKTVLRALLRLVHTQSRVTAHWACKPPRG
jgi:uncharacterized protein